MWFFVIYLFGSIIGFVLGGLLVEMDVGIDGVKYFYLILNFVVVVFLVVSVIVLGIWFKEILEGEYDGIFV